MAVLLTPNAAASDERDSDGRRRRISARCSSVRILRGGGGTQYLRRRPVKRARPFRIMSSKLSRAVPKNRCSGLTQLGLSQEWHTNKAGSNSPKREDVRRAGGVHGPQGIYAKYATAISPHSADPCPTSIAVALANPTRETHFWRGDSHLSGYTSIPRHSFSYHRTAEPC